MKADMGVCVGPMEYVGMDNMKVGSNSGIPPHVVNAYDSGSIPHGQEHR